MLFVLTGDFNVITFCRYLLHFSIFIKLYSLFTYHNFPKFVDSNNADRNVDKTANSDLDLHCLPRLKLRKSWLSLKHTCDTFLNPNREIWNFWSGNVCLVSGGFHVANFGLFYRS